MHSQQFCMTKTIFKKEKLFSLSVVTSVTCSLLWDNVRSLVVVTMQFSSSLWLVPFNRNPPVITSSKMKARCSPVRAVAVGRNRMLPLILMFIVIGSSRHCGAVLSFSQGLRL